MAALLAAFLIVGCSDGNADTNGLEKKTASEVQELAVLALRTASSVRVSGDTWQDEKPLRLDVRIQGDRASGVAVVDGVRTELTRVGDAVFVRGDESSLVAMGLSQAASARGAGRWLVLDKGQASGMGGFTTDDLATMLATPRSPLVPAVGSAELDGAAMVVVRQENGSELFVTNTGGIYPVRAVSRGDKPGQLDFTEYGVDFAIVAPSGAVPLGEISGIGGSGSGQVDQGGDDELLWLARIGTVRADIDGAYAAVGGEYLQAEMSTLAAALRRCAGELMATGPPSERLRPAYRLVEQACQEYEKGAQCFESADAAWPQGRPTTGQAEPSGPPGRSMEDSLTCGLGVAAPAGQLLGDAMLLGLKAVGRG